MENPTKEKGEQMTHNDDDIASLKTGIDQFNAKTPKEVVDRILELLISFSLPSRASLFDGDTNEAYKHVISNLPLYSTLANLQLAKEQVAIAEAQKQLAEQQTKIAERQEGIAGRIEQGSDRTMKLTQRITCLTYVLTAVGITTLIAVCVQIAVAKDWL